MLAAPAAVAPCKHAVGPFTEKGATIRQSTGAPFVSLGITVSGLAHRDWRSFETSDVAKIKATADATWCGNTVRLQVGQDNLVNKDGTENTTFLIALKHEVSAGEHDHLVVVINAQTEDVGRESAPTLSTEKFWRYVTAVYGKDPQVVYDLFNEPRLGDWRCWHDGGRACAWWDNGVSFLGMQTIATHVRKQGARNLLWVEGPHTATTLSQVRSFPIRGVAPMMYAIHHPAGAHNRTAWAHDFGYLKTRDIAPVVVGEWANYAAVKSECWKDAPTAVPAFIGYLKKTSIGLNAWTLIKGCAHPILH